MLCSSFNPNNIDNYWADFFGLSSAELKSPGVLCVKHRMLDGYHGAWIFQRQSTIVVSVPEIDTSLLQLAKNFDSSQPIDLDLANSLFGSNVARIIGPAYQGYITSADFRPKHDGSVQVIRKEDISALKRLAQACSTDGWDDASVDFDNPNLFILPSGPEILAVASVTESDESSMIGLISHPAYRGQGMGKAVASAATQFALSQKLPVRYQTLIANTGSLRVAESLGFKEFGRSIAVRFKN